jgi:hypothetical protein
MSIMGKDDHLLAPAAQVAEEFDRLALPVGIVAAQWIVEHHNFAGEVSISIEARQKEGEG